MSTDPQLEPICKAMAEMIYAEMERIFGPDVKDAPIPAIPADATEEMQKKLKAAWLGGSPLKQAQTGWRKLSDAIAIGVIQYLTANMKITGIQTTGSVEAAVSGNTYGPLEGNGNPPADEAVTPSVGIHHHSVSGKASQVDLRSHQIDDGTGHIEWRA